MPRDDPATEARILLVDDSLAHAELISRCLHGMGSAVQVTHVLDGESALALLDGTPVGELPALVLLDLRLPRMDGLEVLRAIRKSKPYASLPVLMLSSSDADCDVRAAYEAQANSYLIKPMGFRELKSLLEAVTSYWLRWNQLSPALFSQNPASY